MADENDNVSISKADHATLLEAHKLLKQMWNHPEKGIAFKKDVKAVMGDKISIPEVEVEDRITKPLKEDLENTKKSLQDFKDSIEKEKKESREKKENDDLTSEIEAIKKREGFTDETMEKMVARMKDKKSLDVDAAAAWVKSQMPKPQISKPTGLTPQSMNMFGIGEKDSQWESLNKDPVKYADAEITEIINNPEKYAEFGGSL